MRQELSPQQAVDYLKGHKKLSLHHETLYQLIYADKAAGCDLYEHLRVASKPYRKRYGYYDRRGKIKNPADIDERPTVVAERGRIGDWEGDTIMSKGHQSALLTLIERKTLCTFIIRLTGKHTDLLVQTAVRRIKVLQDRIEAIAFDNGLEFFEHEKISHALDAAIYLAHPYAS